MNCVEREGIQSAHRGIFFEEKFFMKCHNCKQSFQGDVAYDLTKAQLSFIEREFKVVAILNLLALIRRIAILDRAKEGDRIEGEEICDKMLTLVEDDMGNCKPSVDLMSLAVAYQYIGTFHFNVGDDLEKAKYYFEKARDITNTLEDDEKNNGTFINNSIKKTLAEIEARINGDNLEAATVLSHLQHKYKRMSQDGENDIATIGCGVRLAKALFDTYQTIEALRLIDKLVAISRRVHGASHTQTKNVVSAWQRMKMPYVSVGKQHYQVLSYEDDGNSYVVRGPLPKKGNSVGELRSVDNAKTFSVPSADITFTHSLPVMLHGLKKAAHLNGEIGDIRDYCKLSNRYVVHLEGNTSKPVKVKQENLRILFDLPEPKK